MDVIHLLNTLETFLFECVWDRIEAVSELPKILKSVNDAEKEAYISRMTKCEITDVNDAWLENYVVSGKKIHICYHFWFEMDTFIEEKIIWQIKSRAQLNFSIPDTTSVDWSVFEKMNDFFKYYPKYKQLVYFQNISYDPIYIL